MCKWVIDIVEDKEEAMYASHHIFVVDTSFHNKNDKIMSSGYRKYFIALLYLVVLVNQNKGDIGVWNTKLL